MADNVTVNSVPVATREVTYSGDASKHVQVVGITALSGSDDAKTATDLSANSGNKDGGTLRVVLATDQPALTNKLLVTDESITTDDAGVTAGATKVNMVGAMCVAHGSNPDAADAADGGMLLANRHRVQFVIGGHPNSITRTARVAAADGAQTGVAIGPTVSAGSKMVITRLSVMASNANTVNVRAKVAFSTSTTLPTDSTTGVAAVLADHPAVPPGGGFTIGDGSGIIGTGADDEELRWTVDSPTGGHITCAFTYYTIES